MKQSQEEIKQNEAALDKFKMSAFDLSGKVAIITGEILAQVKDTQLPQLKLVLISLSRLMELKVGMTPVR